MIFCSKICVRLNMPQFISNIQIQNQKVMYDSYPDCMMNVTLQQIHTKYQLYRLGALLYRFKKTPAFLTSEQVTTLYFLYAEQIVAYNEQITLLIADDLRWIEGRFGKEACMLAFDVATFVPSN